MLDSNKIGHFISEEREKAKLTQEQLATRLYVTRQAVSKWERGIAMPDYDLLLKLCEIFDVTPNEIIAGERKKKSNSQYVDNIAIDVLKDNAKKRKRLILIYSSIVFAILVLFLIYYFVSTYNKLQIYKISGSDENFQMVDTIAVFSNESAYLKFGGVYSSNSDYDYLEFYYLKDGNKRLVYASDKGDALIIQNRGYNEYFDFNDIKVMLDNFYLDVYYKENEQIKIDTIKLNIKKEYSNKNILFRNDEAISDDISYGITFKEAEVPKKIKSLFKLNNEKEYELSYTKNNKKIKMIYNPHSNYFLLSEKAKDYIEEIYYWKELGTYDYYLSNKNDNVISESSYKDGVLDCITGECSTHIERYQYFESIVNEYFNEN